MKLLRVGSRGKEVKSLQSLLIEKGYKIASDGIFGIGTKEAVMDLQANNNLSADGIVGPNTFQIFQKEEPSIPNSPTKVESLASTIAKKLTEQDIAEVAQKLEVEIAAIKAVYEVESSGSGFLNDNRPKILFEGHIFWKQLVAQDINPERHVDGNEDILYSKWTRDHYKGGVGEYDRLERAREINDIAALASASWGTFQIMGFNYKACGFSSVKTYVDSQHVSEGEHLKAFGNFIKSVKLVKHLKNKDWASFAKGYNGSGYKANKYDEKLAAAYAKHKT